MLVKFSSPHLYAIFVCLSKPSLLKFWRKKVIVLSRAGGNEDLLSMSESVSRQVDIIFLPRYLIKVIFEFYLRESEITDNDYKSGYYLDEKMEYRFFLFILFKFFCRYFGVRAVWQFNVLYYAEVELGFALQKVGIPFVCLQKECLRSMVNNLAWSNMMNANLKSIGASHMVCYNEYTKQAIIKSGIYSGSEIVVTGCARADGLFKLKGRRHRALPHNVGTRKRVVYFMVQPTAGLPVDSIQNPNRGWNRLAEMTLGVLSDYALKHPEVEFLFKGKIGYDEFNLQLLAGAQIPSNVKVSLGGILPPEDLACFDLAIGFNSTALLECLALELPVISVGRLGVLDFEDYSDYLLDMFGSCIEVTDEAELEKSIDGVVLHEKQSVDWLSSVKALDYHLGNSDGKSSHRLGEFFKNILNI